MSGRLKKALELDQGATLDLLLTWVQDGVPVDLQGWEARMEIRADYGAADPALVALTTDPGGGLTIPGASEPGNIYVHITAAQTEGLYDPTQNEFVTDMFLYPPGNGTRYRLFYGEVVVRPKVTVTP